MGYELEGRMAEVCTCKTFCPCTANQQPDGGVCDFNWVFHLDRGQVAGVDVAGLNLAIIGRLQSEGAPTDGTVRAAVFVDDTADDVQHQALLDAFTGKEGGPLADLAGLIGELVTVEAAAIEFDVHQGTGRMATGDLVKAEMEGLRGPDGSPTTLDNTALSGVLGARAYPGLPTTFHLDAGRHGFDFTPNSSTQFEFHYVAG